MVERKYLSKDKEIIEHLEFLNKKHKTSIYMYVEFSGRNAYIYGLNNVSSDVICDINSFITRCSYIVNVVEPSLSLTKTLIKEHFTPFVEEDKIVWSYW